jgi:Domain of unknown function (DUF5710)
MPRIDLKVPFAGKDDAKRLGARWDAARKVWYVPAGMDFGPRLQKNTQAPCLENSALKSASAPAASMPSGAWPGSPMKMARTPSA